jgi:hypothetical protein
MSRHLYLLIMVWAVLQALWPASVVAYSSANSYRTTPSHIPAEGVQTNFNAATCTWKKRPMNSKQWRHGMNMKHHWRCVIIKSQDSNVNTRREPTSSYRRSRCRYRDFSSVRLPALVVTYPQRCFVHTILTSVLAYKQCTLLQCLKIHNTYIQHKCANTTQCNIHTDTVQPCKRLQNLR